MAFSIRCDYKFDAVSHTPSLRLASCAFPRCIFTKAPASSIKSIALSGRNRSLSWRLEYTTAAVNASSVYWTPWNFSKRLLRRLQDHDRLGFSCRLHLHGNESIGSAMGFLAGQRVLLRRSRGDASTSPSRSAFLSSNVISSAPPAGPAARSACSSSKKKIVPAAGNDRFQPPWP